MRKKINITIDEDLLSKLKEEMKKKSLNLSRLIESKLLESNKSDLEARVKKLESLLYGSSIAKDLEKKERNKK